MAGTFAVINQKLPSPANSLLFLKERHQTQIVMITHDPSFNPLWTNSYGMQLLTPVSGTLARKQICLMLQHSCQRTGGAVIYCRFSQPCVSVAVQHVARMIESSDTFSTGRYGSIRCLVGGLWRPSRLPPNC